MTLSNVISFVAGVAIGGGACYYILGKRFDERLERELKAYRAMDDDDILVEPIDTVEEANAAMAKAIKSYEDEAARYATPDDEVDPVIFEHPEEYDPEDVEDEDLVNDREIEKQAAEDSGKKPTIITSYSYWNEYEHFDKVTLLYFVPEEQLCTEDEEIVDAPERFVGDALTKYDFANSRERVLYVRNFRTSTDYEINKVFASLNP